jgi:exonuclease III
MNLTSINGWDRTFLNASSILSEPLCKAYELVRYRLIGPLDEDKFDNFPIVQECAFRALIAVGASLSIYYLIPSAILLGIASKIFRGIGLSLQKNGYTYVKTEAPEIEPVNQVTVMTQNFCAIPGGFHYDRGGVTSWRNRIDAFVEKILEKKPDTIILQEIYDVAAAEAFVKKLGHAYPHFFMHTGGDLLGGAGGVMMITKHPIEDFTSISFKNNDWTLNRTFCVLETPQIRIIGTHIIHGNNLERKDAQVKQIMDYLADHKENLTIIGADFNIERDEEGREILDPHLKHGYTGNEPTCTSKLTQQWTHEKDQPDEILDNISQVNGNQDDSIEEVELLRAFDNTYNTRTALSDHHGLLARIRVN